MSIESKPKIGAGAEVLNSRKYENLFRKSAIFTEFYNNFSLVPVFISDFDVFCTFSDLGQEGLVQPPNTVLYYINQLL